MTTWSHPDLGTFRFDEYYWTRTVTLPAFKAFKYRFRARNVGSSKVCLRIDAEDVEDLPSRPAITIAKRLLRNEETLVPKLLKALFNDLHGKGSKSGMWWHGDIGSIYEDLAEETGSLRNLKLESPESLAKLLGKPSIHIQESAYGYNKPCAVICFEALFEMEHGVGILTDGMKILGTGYVMDVSPFS